MEYGVTVGRKGSAALYKQGKAWAKLLGLPFVARPRKGTLEEFCTANGFQALLVATHLGPQVFTSEGILRYHPSMGVPRIRILERGGTDHLVEACDLKPGDKVLDCTLGLAADAAVASFVTGSTGKVVGLEASPVLWFLVTEGLKGYTLEDDARLTRCLRRIETHWTKAEEYLQAAPADSFDVVYFDPMFQKPVGSSSSMQPLRPASYHKGVTPDMVALALRAAPRVVIKERDEELLRSLGAEEIQGGKYSKVRYGIIRRQHHG